MVGRSGTAETEDGPNTYDDRGGGIFAEFQIRDRKLRGQG